MRFLLTLLFILLLPAAAGAQSYPTRPIRLIVPFAPGGTTDILSRLIAARMAVGLGQPILVENKSGAGGNIGTEFVARSVPDGYTILVGTPGPMAINMTLMAKVPYEPVRDFAAIGQFVDVQSVIIAGLDQPFRSLADVLAQARQNPGKLAYATAGIGSSTHLAMELLKSSYGVQMTHIPYKGDTPALADLMGGAVPLMVANMAGVLAQVKAVKVRPIAVAGPKRSPLLPDVPTVAESGLPGFGVTGWGGLVAPAGTPRAAIDRLNAELVKALSMPDVIERVQQYASEVTTGTPEQFAELIKSENVRWARVIREAKIQTE